MPTRRASVFAVLVTVGIAQPVGAQTAPAYTVEDIASRGNRVEQASYQSRFVETRGIRLHYLDFGGAGLPLIFVHDWYEDAHTWTTMAPQFADTHRVLAMTRRGYGQSDDVGWGYDVATQAEDILGFMDALGVDRAVLVGRHPTTQDMTWIAEHHPQRLAGLVYLYHAVAPSPGDARILRDRTFAEMFYRFGGCWMGEEAYERAAPRLPYRPHYIDDADLRIGVPGLSFTHPQDFAAGMVELDFLDVTLAEATSADPGGGLCDAASIEASVTWLTELAGDADRLAAARTLVPTSAERRGYAEAFERAFGSNLRVVRLDEQPNYRTDPDAYIPHMRSFLADLVSADDVAALTARYVESLNDEWAGGIGTLFASDATLALGDGVVLDGRDAIVRGFFRPTVARIRGLVPTSSDVIEGEQRVTVVTTYLARFAPAPDTVQGSFSNTWARQSDGSWLITAATFDLPGWQDDGTAPAGIRSGFFEADGLRLHYLDSGGDGVPLLFMPLRDRTAYSFIEFAERFTDRHRVLAITSRGTGQSAGELEDVFSAANQARDAVALLDALRIERAVVVPAWSADIGITLGNLHPDRLAGLIFSNGPPTPDLFDLMDADTSGMLAITSRLFFSADGLDPDEALRQLRARQEEAGPYRRLDAPIRVPALAFVGAMGTADVEGRWETELARARWVADDPAMFGDSVSREFYLRLASDERLQESVRVLYRDFVAPRYRAVEETFASAFGSCLRLAPVEARGIGYGYRDAPDMIYPHIRRFLDDVNEFEGCAVATEVDTIHVAAPTGEREVDRASILAALAQVQPGGTIQFAPGSYAVGALIPVATPRITLLGHPQGTTLRGCEPSEYEEMAVEANRTTGYGEYWAIVSRCGMFEMTGGHGTIRGFTFEYTERGLILGCCYAEGAFRPSEGGYLVEGNTFRESDNGVRPILSSAAVTRIRNNRFINTFHAVSAVGSRIHVTDNEISVPEPRHVPGRGHPGFGIGFSPGPALCEENVIAGNRVEGHETGIVLFADPDTICRANIIQDNTIIVHRVPLPAAGVSRDAVDITAEADSTIVGVPVTLHNPTGEGRLERNVIEANRILGAAGIGIEVLHASMNRIIGNSISDVVRRDPFPGNTLGGNPERWELANGSGIWISPGSDKNEIVGNTFQDIAAAAVVLEGDRNRVETRSASDGVRDLGAGNHVVVLTGAPAGTEASAGPAGTTNPEAEVRTATDLFIAALNDEVPEQVASFYTTDATKTFADGTVLEGRDAIVEKFVRPVVSRIRGMRAVSEPTVRQEREGRLTVEGTFALRWAPAQDTVEIALSNTWTRQPDGRWLITAGTFELPRGIGVENLHDAEGSDDDAVRSRFFHNEGRRLHYLDFGGAGLPILFVPAMDRTAYTFLDFAPRFTDGHRVLAITNGGSGQSEGRTTDLWAREQQARDVVALLDTLGIPHAVIVGRWPDVPILLAENHGDRAAGLVILSPENVGPSWQTLRTKDSTGVLGMVDRWGLAAWGLDPGEPAPWHGEHEPRYLRSGGTIEVPALAFRGAAPSGKGAADLALWLELAELAAAEPESFPDSVSGSWFQRLSADAGLRAEVRAFYEDVVDPAFEASERAFRAAFGDHLRLVRLDLEEPITGYAYRDHPEPFVVHIRRFLHDVQRREY
jgi:pimeloyl-ACP methyl ester carboxylesterase/ketosteroid isomerase-like protein